MGDMAESFKALKAWNKSRDRDRRIQAERFLRENDIGFTIPSIGCYKIATDNQLTVMFYPKSGTIIWKKNKADRHHRFINKQPEKILKQLRKLI